MENYELATAKRAIEMLSAAIEEGTALEFSTEAFPMLKETVRRIKIQLPTGERVLAWVYEKVHV